MARVFDGTDDRCSATIGVMPTAVPVTLSAWVNLNSSWAAGTHTIAKVGNYSSYRDFFRIQAYQSGGGTTRFEAVSHHGSGPAAQHGSSITAPQWYHVCGVFTSTTSRQIYVDGVSGTENTSTSEPDASVFSHFSTGSSMTSGSNANFLYGKIAEAAIWNAALSTSEITSLANGVNAMTVRDENLKGYWPMQLYGAGGFGSDIDYMGGQHLSPDGATLDFSTHPIIELPAFPLVKRLAETEPSGTTLIKVIQAYYNVNR